MPNWLQYRSKYHATTTQLAEIANRTHPGLLIVYHRGVGPTDHAISDEQYLTEIQRTYHGKVVIGQDLDVYRTSSAPLISVACFVILPGA